LREFELLMISSLLLSLAAATYIATSPPPVSTEIAAAIKPACKCNEPKTAPIPEVAPAPPAEAPITTVEVPQAPMDSVKSTLTDTLPNAPEGYLPYKVQSESAPVATDVLASSESLKWGLPWLVAASLLL
jgi:hypothetical protein